ncbi:MAG TPA: HD domain-containing phosphohydrolase [Bdellovibrionota bacterium]|jgi:HD-GYP domain-containing protein (c-di-GMP phosphodiesterase class II)|nr:HD domain-containing phosphohydrolase [Bdellovibrionota bacterium]
MAASSSGDDKKGKYKSVKPEVAPKNDDGASLVDLYVHLPTSKKFIKWVTKGESLEPSHVDKIKNHVDPVFYAEESTSEPAVEAPPGETPEVIAKENTSAPEVESEERRFHSDAEAYEAARLVAVAGGPKTEEPEVTISAQSSEHLDTIKKLFGTEKAEVLAEPIDHELKNIYSDIGGSKPGSLSLQDSRLNKLSDKICSVISPEVGDVRGHLRNIPAFVSIMDESSAISTLAILFAVAQGQKTRGVFKDLSYACLLMDISLVGAPEDLKKKWYSNPDSLNADERAMLEAHPRKSHAVVMEKFKNLPEIVGQMILGHHELFSGRGFPRKVRSDLLPPVVRILAFAVDVHAHMKRAESAGNNLSVESVVETFTDPKTEPHLRRHNIELCRKILHYMANGETE